MLFGLQLGLLRREPWRRTVEVFLEIQQEFSLQACEVHLEAALYEAAFWPWEEGAKDDILATLRPAVRRLGIHLPFFDMNPVSANPRVAEASRNVLEESICFAAEVRADYVVFHARGCSVSVVGEAPNLAIWLEVLTALATKASELGVTFCLENADDLRQLEIIRKILQVQPEKMRFCLDIGHLYERVYPRSRLLKNMLVLNDWLSPIPFLWKSGLPVAAQGSWPKVLASLMKHLGCLHLHNHDGRNAHRRLKRGNIRFGRLKEFRQSLGNIPLILEADYRGEDVRAIREDICYLEELLCS